MHLHRVEMGAAPTMLMLNHLLERLDLGFHGLASRMAGKNAHAIVLLF
jgi:hypothetical protein